jgi:hypothetical protein
MNMPSNKSISVPRKKIGVPDNQQERLKTIGWITGYVDGEGCFSVSFIRNATTKSGWQIFPEFVVTQRGKSKKSLEILQRFFGCGKIFVNRRFDNHREHIYRYCVRSQDELRERIIPFFEENLLCTAKKEDFKHFSFILDQMSRKKHLTKRGMQMIAKRVEKMNHKKTSRFLESSETTC